MYVMHNIYTILNRFQIKGKIDITVLIFFKKTKNNSIIFTQRNKHCLNLLNLNLDDLITY